MINKSVKTPEENRDPISGAPGAHPVGTGIGAAATGAAIGAAGGAIGGPVGAAVGAVVGAVGGGLAGKAAAEHINPTAEEAYWRKNFASRPYAHGESYETYRPAYRYGWESRAKYPVRTFDEAEPDLRQNWMGDMAQRLPWEKARFATRDAWDRIGGQTTK